MKIKNLYLATALVICLTACDEKPSSFTATIDEKMAFEADFCKAQEHPMGCYLYATHGNTRFDLNIPVVMWQEGSYHFWPITGAYESAFKYTPNINYPDRHYYGHMGSIGLHNAAEDWITGDFIFWAVNSLNPNDSIQIWGEYDRVPL